MKIKYLGTAASEGIPALFCDCEVCLEAREKKGKYIRSRSQALINEDLLIDFPADTYMHILNNNIDTHKIKHLIITHNHSDHFYPNDLECIKSGFGNYQEKTGRIFEIYGTPASLHKASYQLLSLKGTVREQVVYENTPFTAGDYKITPLKAIHAPIADPVIYLIEQNGKSVLYAHDTDYLDLSVWTFLKENNIHPDLISLDCTEANLDKMPYVGHMNLKNNIKVKEEMLRLGIADENTIFVCNHFSHNGKNVSYGKFCKLAEKYGFITSFDGMEIEF